MDAVVCDLFFYVDVRYIDDVIAIEGRCDTVQTLSTMGGWHFYGCIASP